MLELPDLADYYQVVWLIVCQIPPGQVATYGQIASMIPVPPDVDDDLYHRLSPRIVGNAMGAISGVNETTIPWHRVVNSRGAISLPMESAAANLQRARLRAENIAFDMKERIDLATFGWPGPSSEWLAYYQLLPPHSLGGSPGQPSQLSLF